MADHEKVVVPAAEGYDESDAAYVVRGSETSEPATTPEELSRRVSELVR
jgi:hypothetical protein